jgi:hypothetical protein
VADPVSRFLASVAVTIIWSWRPKRVNEPGTNTVVAAMQAEDSFWAQSRWVKWEPIIDSVLVALLAIASLAAAWSAYQANLWGGEQSANYAQASARRIESTRQSTLAQTLTIIDVTTFTNYVDAYAQGNTKLADFYVARFRPDFRPAFDAWIATDPLNNPDAPSSPFVMTEYALPQVQQANALESDSESLFQQGQHDNDIGDEYVLNTVFLAIVLFFAGIAPRVTWPPARFTLIAMALVMLVIGLIQIATLPIA